MLYAEAGKGMAGDLHPCGGKECEKLDETETKVASALSLLVQRGLNALSKAFRCS